MQNFGSNLLGSFFAPLVLVAIASTYNWRWAFFLSGVPGLIMAMLIAKYVREPATAVVPALPGVQTAPPLAEARMGYAAMLQHRNMWLCMLMAIFMVAWMVLGWAFLPLFYIKVRQIGNGQMSVLMSVLGLSAAFFSFVVPALSDRFGRRPVIVIFNFIGLLVPLAALHFHGSLFMLGTLIFIGWSASGTFPLFMGTVPSETIPARYVATSLGMVVGLGEILGGVGAPAIAGRAADQLWPAGAPRDHDGLCGSSVRCWRCFCADGAHPPAAQSRRARGGRQMNERTGSAPSQPILAR